MAFDKVIDSAVLEADLTSVADAIRKKGGTSETLSFPDGFVSAVEAISGGMELNFEVVGNPKPSAPKENTIWINTDTDITEWRIAKDNPFIVDGINQATGGEVWIVSNEQKITVEFNALKKNGIQAYLGTVKQYVNNRWIPVTSMCYQNGEWIMLSEAWNGVLFDNGDQYESITGGWTSSGYNYTHDNYGSSAKGTVTIGDTISASFASGSGKFGIAGTANLIDLTGITYIKCTASDAETAFLCIHTSKTYSALDDLIARKGIQEDEPTILDVSGMDYPCYVILHVHSGGGVTRKFNVSKIWTE